MRRLALIGLLACLCAPASAGAATVSVEDGTLRVSSGTGEPNFVTLHHRAENELVVYDPAYPGPSLSAGPGCSQDGGNTVTCPAAGVARAEIRLGDPAAGGRGDVLTITQAVPIPVSVTADPGAGGSVRYIEQRAVSVSLDGVANDGPVARGDNIGTGVDHVATGDDTDWILGNGAANHLYGSWGGDEVLGGGGDDTLILASYNDVGLDAVGLESHGGDVASCGDGTDTVHYDASDVVDADCERRVLVNDDGFNYRGTARGDRIIAEVGPATVRGGAGDDRLGATRDAGGVALFGESGDDRLAGNRWEDRLDGGSGTDSLAGVEGADRLTGGRGRDSISGGSGPDSILARDGFTDTIRCGSGRDTVSADRRDRVARDCERVRR